MTTTLTRFGWAALTALVFLLTSAIVGPKAPPPVYAEAQTVTITIPTWSDVAADFPACTDAEGHKGYPAAVVVADAQTGAVSKVPTDKAWKWATDKNADNDAWTLGACPR